MDSDSHFEHAPVSKLRSDLGLFVGWFKSAPGRRFLSFWLPCRMQAKDVAHPCHFLSLCSHWDHTGGNMDLKAAGGVEIVGPATEKIPGIDKPVKGGDAIDFGSTKAHILDVGGHTKGHIAYYFPDEGKVFVGDSLFALGCGKMFEGTPTQFWASLKTLRELPDETTVYWYVHGHVCTYAQCRFLHRRRLTSLRSKPTAPMSTLPQMPSLPCRSNRRTQILSSVLPR